MQLENANPPKVYAIPIKITSKTSKDKALVLKNKILQKKIKEKEKRDNACSIG